MDCVMHQILEQLELGGGELDGVVAAPHLVGGQVDDQVAEAERPLVAPRSVGCELRRSTARIRATSSSMLNGLVT